MKKKNDKQENKTKKKERIYPPTPTNNAYVMVFGTTYLRNVESVVNKSM